VREQRRRRRRRRRKRRMKRQLQIETDWGMHQLPLRMKAEKRKKTILQQLAQSPSLLFSLQLEQTGLYYMQSQMEPLKGTATI